MTQDTNTASGAATQRVIEAARRVADDSTDLGEDFRVPSHDMAPLSLALDEYDAALASAPASSQEYAELPKNRCVINTYMLSEDDARAFADATCALRTGGKPC